MKNIYDFNEIGYVSATFPVDAKTKEYLEEKYMNGTRVDVNDKRLAVKLNADGTVGFGASTPTASDKVLGILNTYEMDGSAGVQIKGGVDEVPTKAAVQSGLQSLVVNDKGQIVVLDGGRELVVAKPSTSDNLFASIIL